MIIKKKIWPEYFDLVKSGKKKFELRLADFDISEGDALVLEEWDPKRKEYTGRRLEKLASSVLKLNPTKFWSQEEINKHGIYVIELK